MLKVLCDFASSGPYFVRSGWGRAFRSIGVDFRFWSRERKSAHDAFFEFEPDIYLGATYDVDVVVEKCIRARPHLQVALFASAWGAMSDALDKSKYPIVRVTDDEKRRLESLKRDTGQPTFVFVHATGRYLEGTMSGWRTIGIEPVGLLNAADVLVYDCGRYRQELACDVGYVGGKWGYKARNIDRWLLPLCEQATGLKVKIFSNSLWQTPYCLGSCTDQQAADLFASATVCPNISEPHSTDAEAGGGWDAVERMYKTQLRGFCVSDYVQEAAEFIFPEGKAGVVYARSPVEYQEIIQHYAAHPEERGPFMERGRRWILDGHTYHHRVSELLAKFGRAKEAKQAMDFISNLEQ